MKYILYLLTLALVFAGGMMAGHLYLPDQTSSLAKTVAAPGLSSTNPILNSLSREDANTNIATLSQALSACPVIVEQEKERLVKQIQLRLAIEDFELKKAKLELELAKNEEQNRTTPQFVQATTAYTQAKAYVEKLADELFPVQEVLEQEETSSTKEEVPAEISQPTKN